MPSSIEIVSSETLYHKQYTSSARISVQAAVLPVTARLGVRI